MAIHSEPIAIDWSKQLIHQGMLSYINQVDGPDLPTRLTWDQPHHTQESEPPTTPSCNPEYQRLTARTGPQILAVSCRQMIHPVPFSRRTVSPMAISTPPAPAANGHTEAKALYAWNQVAMRSYMRVVLCFPFDKSQASHAVSHITDSLAHLATDRPDFAGTLRMGTSDCRHHGQVLLCKAPGDRIPFDLKDISEDFGLSYCQLKEASFPPGAFVHPRFSNLYALEENGPAVPVARVQGFQIHGGLLLSVFFHHSVSDGDGLGMFLDSFAAQTRGKCLPLPSVETIASPGTTLLVDSLHVPKLEHLVLKTPEYCILGEPQGPICPNFHEEGTPMHLIRKTGRTFVFSKDRLQQLRLALHVHMESPKPPSIYTCLAALAWAHIAKARLRDNKYLAGGSSTRPDTAMLQTMVNWKSRAFPEASRDYFGNATAVAVTKVATNRLGEACVNLRELARIVSDIETTIRNVDEQYVLDRTALFEALPDPRLLGLDFDPRTPQDLGFNTWRYFGADAAWDIPGAGTCTPDVIRRAQDEWNMSGALILPARKASPVLELLVTLPLTSMDLLGRDDDWMRWVDRVVG